MKRLLALLMSVALLLGACATMQTGTGNESTSPEEASTNDAASISKDPLREEVLTNGDENILEETPPEEAPTNGAVSMSEKTPSRETTTGGAVNIPEQAWTNDGDGISYETPSPYTTYEFTSLDELRDFYNNFRLSDFKSYSDEIVISFAQYIRETRAENRFYAPYYSGEPVPYQNLEGFSNITVFASDILGLPNVWHAVRLGEVDTKVVITELDRFPEQALSSLVSFNGSESATLIVGGAERDCVLQYDGNMLKWIRIIYDDLLIGILANGSFSDMSILEPLTIKTLILK